MDVNITRKAQNHPGISKDERQVLLNISKQYGTPVYVYDTAKIKSQVERLNKAFSGLNFKIKYAVKALTNISIIKYIKSLGCWADTVSIEEVDIAIKAGYNPSEILFTPNCVPFREIEQGVERGVLVNIDNLHILEKFGEKYGNRVSCCIRINPHIAAGGHSKIQTGHDASKFGISIEQIEDIYAIVKKFNIRVTGLHVHTGSDITDVDVFMQSAQTLFDIAHHFDGLEFIDFGSGFKVPYQEGDKGTDLELLGERMTRAFNRFCEDYGKSLELWFEPGKFLVSEAGMLLVEVSTLKNTPTVDFACVYSGQNHLIRPMMYDAYHEIINISNPEGPVKTYDVVGYICETDNLAWERELNEVREGDILAIKNAGAYGMSMSNNYNSRPRPAEVLLVEDKPYLIRKMESLEDILRNQIEINF